MKIAIVDDEECILDTFKWYLEDQGHKVFTAKTAMQSEPYRECGSNKECPCHDILFVDLNLPQMSGLEFVELISDRGCITPRENRIIMSGNLASLDMDKVKRLGCQTIPKPVSFRKIDELLHSANKVY